MWLDTAPATCRLLLLGFATTRAHTGFLGKGWQIGARTRKNLVSCGTSLCNGGTPWPPMRLGFAAGSCT